MMRRCWSAAPLALASSASGVSNAARRWCAAAKEARAEADAESEDQKKNTSTSSDLTGGDPDVDPDAPPKNIRVYSNTTKAVYLHYHNRLASVYWFRTDFHFYYVGVAAAFIGTQVLVRYRVAKMTTVQQARLGADLLDQRTRDLLSDIETLREKDPLRLESEANAFHELFWNLRAKKVAESRSEARKTEINRGLMQGEARGTDMSEWLGAKHKDDSEREIARRTHDYIQGFHQHLKSKRLI